MEAPKAVEPKTTVLDPNQKSAILMAISQLDMLNSAFTGAPKRVQDATVEFKAALQEWADGKS